MKISLSFVTAALLSAHVAVAAPTERDMVVHTSKTNLDVKVDATTATCTGGELKVVAPKLGALTLLNHNDFTLQAPALSAGTCAPGRMPQDIIDPGQPVVSAEMLVKAIRRDRVDLDMQTCTTYVVERVETTIRGLTFTAEQSTWAGYRPVAQCNGGDSPADDPGDAAEPQANSCAASRGGSAWVGLLLALGLVLRRRR